MRVAAILCIVATGSATGRAGMLHYDRWVSTFDDKLDREISSIRRFNC